MFRVGQGLGEKIISEFGFRNAKTPFYTNGEGLETITVVCIRNTNSLQPGMRPGVHLFSVLGTNTA